MRHKRILITLYIAVVLAVSGLLVRSLESVPSAPKEPVSAAQEVAETLQDAVTPVQEADAAAKSTPSKLAIPAIGIDAPVISVGVTPKGIMDTPNNFVQAGWYMGGTLPGQPGSAVIGAHVDNGGFAPTVPGAFKRLRELSPGDVVTVTMDNGTKMSFTVLGSEVYDYKNVDTEKLFNQKGAAYLKLITCHGKWVPADKTYNQRIVVTAVLK